MQIDISSSLNVNAFHKRFFFVIACIIICMAQKAVMAQNQTFSPSIENIEFLKAQLTKSEKTYEDEIVSLPPQNKKDLAELYKSRWENVKETFDTKEIYTSSSAQQYIDALLKEIVKANPLLTVNNIQCYFSRSGIPNASYIGEGIILFNMGLFSRLNNESQAAFILCHEIAHFYLKHSENSIAAYVTKLNSDDIQSKLRSIKRNEYGKRQELEKLLKGLTFDTRRHGRDHEGQADSLAVEFMHNSHFDVGESLTTLSLLDSVDTDDLDVSATMQKMFNAKEYPFQKRWIVKEEGLLGGHAVLDKEEALSDSLKTHPDCKLRIKNLEPLVNKYSQVSSPKSVVDLKKFIELKNIFPYEVVEYAFTSKNYTKSLYYTTRLLQDHASDPYLIANIGRVFNGMYDAQKSHTLGKVIDLPSPFNQPNYNLILQFIQNLYLGDFAAINYYYLKQYETQLSDYVFFKDTYKKSAQLIKQ